MDTSAHDGDVDCGIHIGGDLGGSNAEDVAGDLVVRQELEDQFEWDLEAAKEAAGQAHASASRSFAEVREMLDRVHSARGHPSLQVALYDGLAQLTGGHRRPH